MNTKEAGKLGGDITSKKYGKEHYKKLAKHMNEVKKEYGQMGKPWDEENHNKIMSDTKEAFELLRLKKLGKLKIIS